MLVPRLYTFVSGLEPCLSNKIPDPVEQCLARSARFREAHPLVLCAQRPNDDEQVINSVGTPPFSRGSVSSRKLTGLGGWTPANDRGPGWRTNPLVSCAHGYFRVLQGTEDRWGSSTNGAMEI